MGMMNPMIPMVNGGNMKIISKEQEEEWKKKQRYKGYLWGKCLAKMKKNKEQELNPKPQEKDGENDTNPASDSNKKEITIKFKKGGKNIKIKMKGECMIAELLNKYSLKTNNTGPFKYKGKVLDINDFSSLIEKGMKDGDEIIVG